MRSEVLEAWDEEVSLVPLNIVFFKQTISVLKWG